MSNTEITFEDILGHRVATWWDEENVQREVGQVLEFVDDIELTGESYSFDLIRFWVRKDTGQILYATDSGCSCPSPFEDTEVRELSEVELSGVELAVTSRWAGEVGWGGGVSRAELQADIRRTVAALETAQKRYV